MTAICYSGPTSAFSTNKQICGAERTCENFRWIYQKLLNYFAFVQIDRDRLIGQTDGYGEFDSAHHECYKLRDKLNVHCSGYNDNKNKIGRAQLVLRYFIILFN